VHEYDLIADWYAAERRHEPGMPELRSLIAALPAGAAVLDVGCGNGVPLTRHLVDAGCVVLGVDSSAKMLSRFRLNCPTTPFICSPIQSCDLNGMAFDAAIAWGVLFHLNLAEQELAVARIAAALKPGASFLFTAGDAAQPPPGRIQNPDGSIEGEPMNGVPFCYWAYSAAGYRDLLRAHAMTLVDTHLDAGRNIYYLAKKTTWDS
jgi:SAM-dependent methyltransferase